MNMPAGTTRVQEMEAAIAEVGYSLQQHLLTLVEATGLTVRPAQFVRRFGLDKSLAGRLTRALRSDSPLDAMHLFPSPQGLRIVLDRARTAGAPPEALAGASDAIARFQDLIDSIDGGRTALDGLISDSRMEVRRRREETSKQAIYRAMSFILGYACDVITTTLILSPSGDGENLDVVELHHRVGMRRLRPSTPLALLSLRFPSGDAPGLPRIVDLDGQGVQQDPGRVMLPEFGSRNQPDLEIVQDGDHTVFVLAENDPSLAHPVTLTSAYRIRRAFGAVRTPALEAVERSYLLHYPCRLLVRDVFVAEECFQGIVPEIFFRIASPPGAPISAAHPRIAQVSRLDLEAPVQSLQPGYRDLWVRGAARYRDLIEHAFARTGLDPLAYRGYRCTVSYPVPMLLMGWQVPLPV